MLKLREIAALTGVSKSAVSRVLNNSGYVAQEKRKVIEAALRENGYQVATRRNAIPRSADRSILILVESLENAAYDDYIRGICHHLLAHDFHPFVFVSYGKPELELEQIQYATSIGMGGVIMLSVVESPALLDTIKELSCPLVLLNRRLPSADVDTVIMDNYMVGYLSTQYLIQNGHTQILHLAGLRASSAANDRCRGYTDAMAAAALTPRVQWNINSYNESYRCALAKKEPFTGVFSLNDTVALGFIDALYAQGFTCPQDFSIVCTENTRTTTSGKVPITAVGYDNAAMGDAAAALLMERLHDPDGAKKTISFTPSITPRASVRNIREG